MTTTTSVERSLLLVPNHPVELSDRQISVESAEADLLRTVRCQFARIGVAAFVSAHSFPNLVGSLERPEFVCHRLNVIRNTRLAVAKWLNYLYAVFRMPFVLARYDVVYIFCPGHCAMIAALWARVLAKPYGFYVRGTWLNSRGDSPALWRFMFTGARFMVATGEPFRRRLLQYCRNVVNEVPLTALRPDKVGPYCQSHKPASTLMFAGRLTESKGILDVIRAQAVLGEQGLAVELIVAGGGTPSELQRVVDVLEGQGVRAAVRLLGHVSASALEDVYRRADIFVYPSYYAEGFPRVLYEAMMFQKPIITCRMPGTDGFLVHERNCLYCEPRNPVDLARCVSRLLTEDGLARKLGDAAHRDVVALFESFNHGSHAQQLLALVA